MVGKDMAHAHDKLPGDFRGPSARVLADETGVFFEAQTPSYRKGAMRWVLEAKQEETRLKRLATLIDDSANNRFIPPFKFSTTKNREAK